jgi:hypothetical protein
VNNVDIQKAKMKEKRHNDAYPSTTGLWILYIAKRLPVFELAGLPAALIGFARI